MSRDGNGNYSLPAGNPVSGGTTIDPTWANTTLADIAAALTGSVSSDGQTTMTGNLKMNGNTLTSLASATSRTNPPTAGQVQDSSLTLLSSVSGTDTITATISPAISSYTAGQVFQFIAVGANSTTTVTMNINGLGAKNVLRSGGGALAANDIKNGQVVELYYNGTNFEFVNSQHVSLADAATTANSAPWSGLTGIPANIISVSGTDNIQKMSLFASQASTSGTSITFTSVPTWAKRITVMFDGVSTNGTSQVMTQLGTASGIEASGYNGSSSYINSSSVASAVLTGSGASWQLTNSSAARSGHMTFTKISGNTWVYSGVAGDSSAGNTLQVAGSKTLVGTLDRVSITTVSGTEAFDSGNIGLLVEGY